MELNERLASLRKSKGMTQEAMAQALLVSRQTIYKWETGKAQPDLRKFAQICALFNISADSLLCDAFLSSSQENQGKTPSEEKVEDDPPVSIALAASEAAGESDDDIAMATTAKPWTFVSPKRRNLFLWSVIALAFVASVLFFLFGNEDEEIKAARRSGIVATSIQTSAASIAERDFFQMLLAASKLQHPDEMEALTDAAEHASNQRLTREKAAYWLYCIHVWTTIDPHADMSIIHHGEIDPISQRNVYEELNDISKAKVNLDNEPWDAFVCEEAQAANQLFESYDGTAEMDAQILSILDGVYYTAITFCASQRSFDTEQPLMELDCYNKTRHPLSKKTAIMERVGGRKHGTKIQHGI